MKREEVWCNSYVFFLEITLSLSLDSSVNSKVQSADIDSGGSVDTK